MPMQPDDNAVPTVAGLPLNRIIAFAGPYISVIAGVAATWLTNNVHLFATFHVGNNDLADAIAQVTVFAITSVVVWLGQHKWLDGYQRWAYAGPPVDPADPPVGLEPLSEEEEARLLGPAEEYDDRAELAALDTLDQGGPPEPEVPEPPPVAPAPDPTDPAANPPQGMPPGMSPDRPQG
jgi:hypothetical protein